MDFGRVPVSGLFRSEPEAPIISAPLAFELCTSCGLVRQDGLQPPRDYSEIGRSTAGQFPAYGDDLVERLRELGVAPNELVLEIGSNDGSFLQRLRRGGFRRLVGIEPSSSLAERAVARRLQVINDYFNVETAAQLTAEYGHARVTICRHVLEHVADPRSFLTAVRSCLHPQSGLALVELPDAIAIPELMIVQDFWDEHLHYFSAANLARLANRAGMDMLEVEVKPHLYTRNLVMWCSMPADANRTTCDRAVDRANVELWRGFKSTWEGYRTRLAEELTAAPRPIYAIGASHPQCCFINYCRIGTFIDYCIDDDRAKIGRFPPVAGGCPSIISTLQFELSASEGTVLETGFGYPRWTERIRSRAVSQGMRLVNPRDFIEPLP